MGSHKPKSTRAAKARSVPKSRRKPAPPKPSKFGTGADVFRDAERRFRVKPHPSPDELAARLAKGKPANIDTAAVDALGAMRDGVPTASLREISKKLELILSSVIVVEHALLEQNVELDGDAARILRIHVGDPLYVQTQDIDRLLGENQDDDEDNGGAS